MFDAGSMRPEWCFVIEEGDRSLGHVALWTLPGMGKPLDLVLLDVPWEDLSTGGRLFWRTCSKEHARSERERSGTSSTRR